MVNTVELGMRKCKPRADYYQKRRQALLLSGWCVSCGKYPHRPNRTRCEDCADKLKADHGNRDRYLREHFAISGRDYDDLLAKQNGSCGICNKKPGKRHLSVDHDHETGEIRGLLCGWCNLGLGRFRDNAILLRAAIKYLHKYETRDTE